MGWKFCFNTGFVSLAQKIVALLCPLCRLKAEVCKIELERLIGLLVWFTHGAVWLRPWLSEFYRLLYKPQAVTRLLALERFEVLVAALSDGLRVKADIPSCDVCKGWKLHSIAGGVVTSLSSPALSTPRIRKDRVSVALFNGDCSSTRCMWQNC